MTFQIQTDNEADVRLMAHVSTSPAGSSSPCSPPMRCVLWLVLLAIGTACPLPAQTPSWAAQVDSAVERVMRELGAPGVSIAILQGGEIVYARGYGVSDVDAGTRATEHTLYRIASLAKPITATAVLRLVQDDVVDLESPVSDYCTEFRRRPEPVTIRQLLAHRGGIRHPTDAEDNLTREFTVSEAVQLFAGDRLVAEPGSRFAYSTFGYVLLSCAAEGATGRSFMDVLEANVFMPAGMRHTTRDTVPAMNPLRSRGYRRTGGRVRPSDVVNTSFKLAGGGLVSNVMDLALFGRALLGGELLSAPMRDVMWTSMPREDGNTPFGLGWQVSSSTEGRGLLVYHTGQQQEVTSLMLLRPHTGYGLIVLTNLERLGQGILRLVGPIRELTELR